ncbi:MAG: TniB family NTP-binding protein [Candidatus Hodarchaeales archaeon]
MVFTNAPRMDRITDKVRERRNRVRLAVKLVDFPFWFDYRRADEVFILLDTAYVETERAQDPVNPSVADIRPLGLIIFGDINNGKTTLIAKYVHECKLLWKEEHLGEEWNELTIVYYEIAARATIKRVIAGILGKFGITIDDRALQTIKTDTLVNRLVDELKRNNVKLLIIDELQDLIVAPKEDISDIFIALKKITNQSKTRLVLVGTNDAIEVLKKAETVQVKGKMKPWIDERFRRAELPKWELNEELRDILYTVWESYHEILPDWNMFSKKDNEKASADYAAIGLIHKLSNGRLGKMLQIIRYAAIRALIKNRTTIIEEDYLKVFNIKYVVKDGQIVIEEETNVKVEEKTAAKNENGVRLEELDVKNKRKKKKKRKQYERKKTTNGRRN